MVGGVNNLELIAVQNGCFISPLLFNVYVDGVIKKGKIVLGRMGNSRML